jgi:transposase
MYKKTYKPKEVINALNVYQNVKSFRKASVQCGISKSTIQRWSVSLKHIFKRKSKSNKRKRIPKYNNLLQNVTSLFTSDILKFTSIKEIQNSLKEFYPNKIPSISRIHRCLKQAKVSRRRFMNTKVCNANPQRLSDLYKSFSEQLEILKDNEILCIDETAFCNFNNQHYGYFNKGRTPLQQRVSKRERTSLIACIHPHNGLVAFSQQEKPFNSETFQLFLKNLILTLPDGVKAIIMDNIAFHRSKKVIEILDSKGIKPLFIPPYSPRCNPIEEVFSWMKRVFRNQDSGSLKFRIEKTIEKTKLYKEMLPYYKHTREHVYKKCLQ